MQEIEFEQKKRAILDRVDLLDVVSQYVALKRRGQRWVGLCPFHTEKTPSFTVRPDHGYFKCFGCGKGGDIFTFVQLRENVPFMEAMTLLADRAGIELRETSSSAEGGVSRADLARANSWALKFFRSRLLHDSIGRSTRAYLDGRKITPKTAERFSLGFAEDSATELLEAARHAGLSPELLVAADLFRCSEDGRRYATFRNRLMFPIRDATGRVVGFGGRTLCDDRAKYLNTRQNALFDKGRLLYGIDAARDAIVQRGRTVVVEGYTDCLAAHQAGFEETVATLGTALTESHVDVLRRYAENVILLFDSDEAGIKASDRAIRIALPRCVTVRLARIPDGKDPSDFLSRSDPGEFSDLLNRATDALEFLWLDTLGRYRGDESPSRRRDAVMDFLRVVAEATDTNAVDAIQRGLLVNQVAHLLGMSQADISSMMARLPGRQRSRAASPSDGSRQSRPSAPASAEQSAWGHVLEVLLNEPGLWSSADPLPDPGRIQNDRDRRIAAAVVGLADTVGEFRLADALAKFDDESDVARALELARRGAARENYAQTFSRAIQQIHHAMEDERVDLTRQECVASSSTEPSDKGLDEPLERFGHDVRAHRSYIPRRFRHTVITQTEGDTTNPTTTLEHS